MRYHIIGDLHGHCAALWSLLRKLDYHQPYPDTDPYLWLAPPGYQLISVGDLVDRGPDSLGCVRTIKRMQEEGQAQWVLGNHDLRYLQMLSYLLGTCDAPRLSNYGHYASFVQLLGLPQAQLQELYTWLNATPCFLELDDDRVIIVHARWEDRFRSWKKEPQRRACAYGHVEREEVSTQKPPPRPVELASGLYPLDISYAAGERRWVKRYKGHATVFWGHDILLPGAVVQIGKTINVESGCMVGHALSAYSYPDGEVTQVRETESWRVLLKPYIDVHSIFFPTRLEDVCELLKREKLLDAEEYLSYLQIYLEEFSNTSMYPALQEAHRAIFARCQEL
ncbi:MAG: metallophosphoesterase [Myxococcales bacterium]|nr:metallophosphoesterase [Myxococcales bacterium]